MCVFRFKMWWMTQRMGTCGQEVPFETQFLLVEAQSGSDIDAGEDQSAATYAVFLPLLEGDFRAVLQGNDQNEIEICVESGMCSSKDKQKEIIHKSVVIFADVQSDEIYFLLQVVPLWRTSMGLIWFISELDPTLTKSLQLLSSELQPFKKFPCFL